MTSQDKNRYQRRSRPQFQPCVFCAVGLFLSPSDSSFIIRSCYIFAMFISVYVTCVGEKAAVELILLFKSCWREGWECECGIVFGLALFVYYVGRRQCNRKTVTGQECNIKHELLCTNTRSSCPGVHNIYGLLLDEGSAQYAWKSKHYIIGV